MKRKGLSIVLCTVLGLAVSFSISWGEVAGDPTRNKVVQSVEQAKTSADHQKLVRFYEQQEAEVRAQASLYEYLADTYGRIYGSEETAAACKEIGKEYNNIAKDYETLAEQHRHLAANPQLPR